MLADRMRMASKTIPPSNIKYVFAGRTQQPGYAEASIWYGENYDNLTQTYVYNEDGDIVRVTLMDIAYGNGAWLVVGDDGTIGKSNDGKNFIQINSPTSHSLLFVKFVADDPNYPNGVWIIGGYSPDIYYSVDNGATWNINSLLRAIGSEIIVHDIFYSTTYSEYFIAYENYNSNNSSSASISGLGEGSQITLGSVLSDFICYAVTEAYGVILFAGENYNVGMGYVYMDMNGDGVIDDYVTLPSPIYDMSSSVNTAGPLVLLSSDDIFELYYSGGNWGTISRYSMSTSRCYVLNDYTVVALHNSKYYVAPQGGPIATFSLLTKFILNSFAFKE